MTNLIRNVTFAGKGLKEGVGLPPPLLLERGFVLGQWAFQGFGRQPDLSSIGSAAFVAVWLALDLLAELLEILLGCPEL